MLYLGHVTDSSQNTHGLKSRLIRSLNIGVQTIIPSGDGRVDGATERLNELTNLPAIEHVAVYEDVHRRLHDALTDNSE